MAKQRSLSLRFPVGGVVRRLAFESQAPFTTPDALNVWPTQWDTGRERGGSRPGLTSVGSVGGAPYNWCNATWGVTGGGTRREIAVTHANGTSVSNGANSWATYIQSAPGSDFSSCAVYLNRLFQATSAGKIRSVNLNSPGVGQELVATAGTAPEKCGIVVAWGDRLVVAGKFDDPHLVLACRIGDYQDWDYAAIDQSSAWVSSGATGGIISDPVTSAIPHNRDCLLVGCTDSLWVLRGNPAAGGQSYVLSSEVGPLSQTAWCRTGNDYVLMLTRDGLYTMQPGCGDPPTSLSREKIPEALMSISPESGDKAFVGYDHRFRGVHIHVRYAGGQAVYYYHDLQSGGFWPMSTTYDLCLVPSLRRASTATRSAVLPIAGSGAVYQYDLASTEAFQSYVLHGPVKLGSAHGSGNVMEARCVLATESDRVSWGIRTGASPQDAFTASESFVGRDWDQEGINYAQHPRVGGNAAYVKLEATGSRRFSVDELTLLVRETGGRRQ